MAGYRKNSVDATRPWLSATQASARLTVSDIASAPAPRVRSDRWLLERCGVASIYGYDGLESREQESTPSIE